MLNPGEDATNPQAQLRPFAALNLASISLRPLDRRRLLAVNPESLTARAAISGFFAF